MSSLTDDYTHFKMFPEHPYFFKLDENEKLMVKKLVRMKIDYSWMNNKRILKGRK